MTAMPANRLKIGLSACFLHADPTRSLFTNKTLQYVEQSIAHWLMSAGALVVMIPCPTGETARGDVKLAHYAQWLDGVVMHGGADVWPGSYGEEPLQEAWIGDRIRDLYDLALVEAFEQAGKPIFGVCRGLQLINVAFGGTLYQDIATQHDHPETLQHRDAVTYDQNFHEIELVAGSRLAQLYPGVERGRVNSIHHQAVKGLAPGFQVEAWSLPDRVPEAIRRPGHRGYIAATQWHPEFLQPGSDALDDRAILMDFMGACVAAKARPRPKRSLPGHIRDRANRLLRQALLLGRRGE
jgi:putative glutamine amidotransferase